ncbi:hypothetical protein BIW11_11559, partial [Tropilaelaps mercedesae]
MVATSQAASCAADDPGAPCIGVVGKLEESSSVATSAFSNTNCLRFEEIVNVKRCRYLVEFQTDDYDLYPIDKNLLFFKEAVKEALDPSHVKAYRFQLPNSLITAGRLPKDLIVYTISLFTVRHIHNCMGLLLAK